MSEQDLADDTTFSALRDMRMGDNEVSSFVMTALSLDKERTLSTSLLIAVKLKPINDHPPEGPILES